MNSSDAPYPFLQRSRSAPNSHGLLRRQIRTDAVAVAFDAVTKLATSPEDSPLAKQSFGRFDGSTTVNDAANMLCSEGLLSPQQR